MTLNIMTLNIMTLRYFRQQKRPSITRQPFLKTKNKKCMGYKDLFCNAFHFSINVCLLYTLSASGKSHPLTNVTL